MGLQRKVRKFGQMKRLIKARDSRIKGNKTEPPPKEEEPVSIPQAPSGMFFQANMNLAPPYSVIVDTNFIVLSVKGKIDLLDGLMNLYFRTSSSSSPRRALTESQAVRVLHARDPRVRARRAREAREPVRDRAAHRQGRAVAAHSVPAQGHVRRRLHRADGGWRLRLTAAFG
jgi:U3 small nucleolar RNA-associated protein 24